MEALIQWLTVFILTKANSMNESVLPHLPGHKNPPMAEITLPRTDSIRGATLFHDIVLFARYHHISGS